MKLATKTGDFNAYTNSQIDSLKLLRKAGFKYAGSIADNFGWIWVFWTLLFVCVAVCIGAGVYIVIKKTKSSIKK